MPARKGHRAGMANLTKAEEARAVAGQLSAPEARRAMLKIAEAREHVAAFVEKQRAIHAKLESSP